MALRVGFNARVLADPDVRGWVRYTVGLLRALSQRDDVDLVLFSDQELHPGHVQGIRARSVIFQAPRESVWNDWELPRKIRQEGIDLFHAPADRGLPLLKPCPMVLTVHGSYERTYWKRLFPTLKGKLWYWKNEWLNRFNSDAVLTVSDTVNEEIACLRIVPGMKLHRVYLAAGAEFQPQGCSCDPKVLEDYKVQPPYVLYVGGYDRHKNVDTLIQAFNQARLPEHQLVVVAKHQWEYPKRVEEWKALPCFSRLRLIEALPHELPAFYRQAEFFVNPSRWESFSFQTLEAMACGTPVLASDRKAIPEIAGGAALLFDPEDVASLSQLMMRVAADENLRQRLREQGLRRANCFSWQACAEQTMSVYRQVVA